MNNKLSVAALAGVMALSLGACKMDNPAFGETGTGDTAADTNTTAGSTDDTAADVSTTADAGSSEVSTGPTDTGDGDGDGEATTGDGDGDGDSNSGDGDGDGDGATCQVYYLDAIQDTFFANGEATNNGIGESACQLDWSRWGTAYQACPHLNFGATQEHWIGTGGDPGSLMTSYYAAEFAVSDFSALPSGTLASANMVMTVSSGEPAPTGTVVAVNAFSPGDGAAWEAGLLDAYEPEPSMAVATFKYQRYNTLTWDQTNPLSEAPVALGNADVSGQSGEHEVVVPLSLPIVSTWLATPLATIGNGVLVQSNSPLFELTVSSIDSFPEATYLELTICTDG